MVPISSSTADAASDVTERLNDAVRSAEALLPSDRAARVSAAIARFKSLERRGLVKRQQFHAPTTGDIRRFYQQNIG